MARLPTWLAGVAAGLPAAILFAQPRVDPARLLADLTRREIASESKRIAEINRRLDEASTELSAAAKSAESAGADSAAADQAEQAVRRALAAVSSAAGDLRDSLARVALLRRRLAEIDRLAGGRTAAPDPLSGTWEIRIDPGGQAGQIRLALEGTLVSGDYTLEGDFHGSLRGTLVEDRVRLERIDARLGFVAVYYGRLAKDDESIAGTWQATDLASNTPSSGTWSAHRVAETEEEH